MPIPLLIAILAFLALALLPVLDRSASSTSHERGIRAFWVRIASWMQK